LVWEIRPKKVWIKEPHFKEVDFLKRRAFRAIWRIYSLIGKGKIILLLFLTINYWGKKGY